MHLARSTIMNRRLGFLALLLALTLCHRTVLGHAVLLETTPASGAVLTEPPREIVLRFNEPVAPISLTLTGHAGQSIIPRDAIASQDFALHAIPPDGLHPGSYIVSYRVVSADSHPISGSFLFILGAPSNLTPIEPDLRDRETTWAVLVMANRMVLLASLLFSAGGVLFAAIVLGAQATPIAPLRRPLRIGALVAIASACLAVALQGGLLTAAPWDAAASWRDGTILTVGWRSSVGTSATLIACGMGLVLLGLGRGRQKSFLWLSAAGAILATGALAASGHAVTAPPRWLATPAIAAHGLVIAFWAGSLWPLLHVLQQPGAPIADVVLRFSRWAVGAVAILIVSGLTLATLQLGGDITALIDTAYGQRLLLKLVIVALLLSLATYNKFRLTPALVRGADHAAQRLAGAIRLEIAAIGLILAVSVVLGQTPPPSAHVPADRGLPALHAGHITSLGQGTTETIQARGYGAVVTVTPARVGRNTVTVALTGPEPAPLQALEVNLDISLPEQGIEPLAEKLRAVAPGRYEGTMDGLFRPGVWQFRLDVLINDFEAVTFETPIRIGD